MKNCILLFVSLSLAIAGFTQVWQTVPSGTSLQLNSVSFGSELVGYIGANDSTLLKTTDGGNTWNAHPTNGLDFSNGLANIIQVDFVSADTGFLVLGTMAYSGAMYKTVDGGAYWTPEIMNMCSPTFSFNFDAHNSYVVGSTCFGAKTIGKRVNGVWEPGITYLAFNKEYLRTITFYDTLYGITAGDSGTVHRTFDGGLNWDEVPTLSSDVIWDLQFVNDSTIYGAIDSLQNTLIFSTDSGATWQEHVNSWTFLYPQWKALAGLKNESIVAVGSAFQATVGVILWGSEASPFWRTETTRQVLNDVTAINDSFAITVGDSGLIMINTETINSLDEVSTGIVVKLYPNPVNQEFTVEVAHGNLISVILYDVLGRVVLQRESAFEQISVASVAPGLYHAVIETTSGRKVMPVLVQ